MVKVIARRPFEFATPYEPTWYSHVPVPNASCLYATGDCQPPVHSSSAATLGLWLVSD